MHPNSVAEHLMNDQPIDIWHPEMRAARTLMDQQAAQLPPVTLDGDLNASRRTNERLAMMWGTGGPEMAETQEHWVFAQGRRVLCRVHRPSTATDLPVLVWFHGGGWVWQSIDTHDRLIREIAAASGCAVVNVDYSLAPETVFPGAVHECAGVVRHIAAEGASWGLDGARIVLGGDSAGGNLALATALALRDGNGPSLRGVLAPYPVTDPDFESESYVRYGEGFGLTRAAMQAYWDLYAPGDLRLHPYAAPLRADVTGLPPVLIQLAELDVLRADGEKMAAKLQAAGVPVEVATYPGVLHGFVRLTESVTPARTAIADAAAWLKRVI
jgi:acetyl esterase